MRCWFAALQLLALVSLLPGVAKAQNLGGVFGPVVNEDDRSAELRGALVPGEHGSPDRFAARFHYQQALTDAVRLRGVVQGSDDGVDGFRADTLQGEIIWQLTPDRRRLQLGLRGDARIGWNDVSDLVGVNLTADYRLTERIGLRGLVMMQRLLGDEAPKALQFQSRAHIAYDPGSPVLTLEYYGTHGSLGDGGAPDRFQLGPVLTLPVDRLYFSAGYLAGLNERSANSDLRLWIGYRF